MIDIHLIAEFCFHVNGQYSRLTIDSIIISIITLWHILEVLEQAPPG